MRCYFCRPCNGPHLSYGWLATLLPLLSLLFGAAGPAFSQAYPAKPVSLIVSSAPGAGVDFFARILADRLRPRLGQAIIVENRPGASGMIAAAHVAKAQPDGYTIILMPNTLVFAPYVLPSSASTVSVIRELAPIVMPVSTPMVLAVNGELRARSVSELIALAKKQPDLPYTGGANGSPMHIIGEQFKKTAGLSMFHVAYKGVAQAVTAAIAGQVNVIWMTTSSGNVKHFQSGALRPLAVTSSKRSPLLPEVPTMIESGYKDIEDVAWFGVMAPLGTPAPIIARLNGEINAVLATPDVRDRLIFMGYVPEGGGPDVLAAQMRRDDSHYHTLITEFGVKAN